MSDNSGETAAKRPDGLPVGKPFQPGQSGNPNGRPPGPDLGTLIRRYLNGEEKLPAAIEATIRSAVGENRKAGEAMIIAGILQALQGNESWAKLLWAYSDGKPPESIEIAGKGGGPIQMQVGWLESSETE